jgi:hypothetical protein
MLQRWQYCHGVITYQLLQRLQFLAIQHKIADPYQLIYGHILPEKSPQGLAYKVRQRGILQFNLRTIQMTSEGMECCDSCDI